MIDGNVALSPNNGIIQILFPQVRFDLKVECEGNEWNFEVLLIRDLRSDIV